MQLVLDSHDLHIIKTRASKMSLYSNRGSQSNLVLCFIVWIIKLKKQRGKYVNLSVLVSAWSTFTTICQISPACTL